MLCVVALFERGRVESSAGFIHKDTSRATLVTAVEDIESDGAFREMRWWTTMADSGFNNFLPSN